jgi:hypothetical protein
LHLLLLLLLLVSRKLHVWPLLLLPVQPLVEPLCLQSLCCLQLQQAMGHLIQARKAHRCCVHGRCDAVVCLDTEPSCCKTCRHHQ